MCFTYAELLLKISSGGLEVSFKYIRMKKRHWVKHGMEWDGMEWNGLEWNGKDWIGLEWNGMEWNGMEWNGMEFYSIMSS